MSAVILHCVAVAVAFRLSVSQHGGKQATVAQRRGQKRCTLPPPVLPPYYPKSVRKGSFSSGFTGYITGKPFTAAV